MKVSVSFRSYLFSNVDEKLLRSLIEEVSVSFRSYLFSNDDVIEGLTLLQAHESFRLLSELSVL